MKLPLASAAYLLLAAATLRPAAGLAQSLVVNDSSRPPESTPLDRPARTTAVDLPLRIALVQLSERSGVGIGFSPSLIGEYTRPVNCRCADKTVGEALAELLERTPFAFFVTRGQVFVAPTRKAEIEARPLTPADLLNDQTELASPPATGSEPDPAASTGARESVPALLDRILGGLVVRVADGEPISDADVELVGTRTTARTDSRGRFHLTVPDGEAALRVRAIGYRRVEVRVPAGLDSVRIELQADILELEEIVVSGQQTGVERRNATTSIAIVGGEDLVQTPAPTLDKALQGKVAGANIQSNSGAPGGGVQIQIRGPGTVLGASDPLFVVDGVIYSNATLPSGLGNLQGVGGGAGEEDAVNRTADLNPADIETIEVLKGAAASSIYGSKAANGVVVITTKRGKAGRLNGSITQRFGFYDLARDPGVRAFDTTSAFALLGRSDADSAIIRSYVVNGQLPVHDFWEEVAGHHPLSYETLAELSGGNDATKYFVSGGWNYDGGIVRNTGAGRQSLRANIDQRLSDRVGLSVSAAFARSNSQRGFFNNDASGAGISYSAAYIPSFVTLQPNASGVYPQLPYTYVGSNPIQTADLMENDEVVQRFTPGANLDWTVHAGDRSSLKLVFAGGADLIAQNGNIVSPPEAYYEQLVSSPGLVAVSHATSRFLNWNANAIHTWTTPRWRLTTSGGAQYEDRFLESDQVVGRGVLPGQRSLHQAALLVSSGENQTTERTFALYGQEEVLALQERLLLAAGLRAERSSANGNANHLYVFPKVSASYRFPGLPGKGSELKLRVAYGQTGNQPLFGQKFTSLAGGQVIDGQIATTVGGSAGAPNVHPERTREWEGGVDANLWNGRVTLDVTGFFRRTSDLLIERTPAPSSGFGSQIVNGGRFRNSGIEVALGAVPLQTKTTNWLVRATFTRLRNNVDSLPDGLSFSPGGFGFTYGSFFLEQGHPIQQILGQVPNPNAPGGFDIVRLGDANPDFRVSLNNELSWKSTSLSFLWEWQQGGSALNTILYVYDCNGLAPDDGTPAGQARTDACFNGDARPFTQSSTFLKLREVTLGWTLPRGVVRYFPGARDGRVSVSGRNLLMFTPFKFFDPEVSDFGQAPIARNVSLGAYPPQRSFFFNLTLGF